jgi:hypothetical protein
MSEQLRERIKGALFDAIPGAVAGHADIGRAADAVLAVLASVPSEPTVCPTCEGSGLDPDDPFNGDPSGMDLHGNLIYDDGYPCPDCSVPSEETTPTGMKLRRGSGTWSTGNWPSEEAAPTEPTYEVFTASDGLPAIRMVEEAAPCAKVPCERAATAEAERDALKGQVNRLNHLLSLRSNVEERMAAESIPIGTDDPMLLALGATPLPSEETTPRHQAVAVGPQDEDATDE